MDFIGNRNNVYFRCVEDSNESVMITDPRGQLVYTNPAWHRTYGFSKEETIGSTPRLLRSKHQDEHFYRRMWSQITDPKIGHWKGKLINLSKSGIEVPVLLTITPYRNVEQKILGYMAIALDLSEQERLEEQIAAQERLVTIGELSSGLAHEIGTPIGVIRGRAEMMAMDDSIGENLKKTLRIIISQADRISSLISTLLKFSRSRNSSPDLKPIAVKKVLNEVIPLVTEKLRKVDVQVELVVDDNLKVWADTQRLEQIFLNLILNSIHAMESAKKVNPERICKIKIETGDIRQKTEIKVSDTGTGIKPEVIDKIFVPFFTTKPAGVGTGLGLSIVSRLIHEMNGSIELDENYHNGAQFNLYLDTFQEVGPSS